MTDHLSLDVLIDQQHPALACEDEYPCLADDLPDDDLRAAFARLLGLLAPDQRQALELITVGGWSHRDAAEEMGFFQPDGKPDGKKAWRLAGYARRNLGWAAEMYPFSADVIRGRLVE